MNVNHASANDQAPTLSAVTSKEAADKTAKLDHLIKIGSGEVYAKDAFYPYSKTAISPQTQAGRLSNLISANFEELDSSFAELPEISPGWFPSWIGNMAKEVAANTQTSPSMALMLSLSITATCLQKKVVVEGLTSSHKEPISIWTCTVLPPGNNKSTVFDEMLQPLSVWAEQQNNSTESDRIRKSIEIDSAVKRIEKLKRELSELDPTDEETRTAKLTETENLVRLTQSPPHELRPFTNDATPEGLRDELLDQGGKAAILSDEAGVLDTLTGMYNAGTSNIDILLKGYTNGDVIVTRAKRNYVIKQAALTMGLCAQPATLEALKPSSSSGTKSTMRGRGFLGRMFFCIPKSYVGHRIASGRSEISVTARAAYADGIRKMLMLVENKTDDNQVCKYTYRLDQAATKTYTDFYQFLESRHGTAPDGSSSDRDLAPIDDWTTKLQGAVLRLSGILHFAEHFGSAHTKQISDSTMMNAARIAKALIPHAQSAFAMMGDGNAPKDKQAAEVYSWVISNSITEFRESHLKDVDELKSTFVKMKPKEFDRVMSVLQRNGVISEQIKIQTGGAPAASRVVNPLLSQKPE